MRLLLLRAAVCPREGNKMNEKSHQRSKSECKNAIIITNKLIQLDGKIQFMLLPVIIRWLQTKR